jgi:excisionase family DNA binding protein
MAVFRPLYIIALFVLHPAGWPLASALPHGLLSCRTNTGSVQALAQRRSPPARKGCAVAAQRAGNTAPDTRSYLRTAEVANILYVSPKTVSRWAKEGKLPSLKTLGGHRRYPAAEIRQLADELQTA